MPFRRNVLGTLKVAAYLVTILMFITGATNIPDVVSNFHGNVSLADSTGQTIPTGEETDSYHNLPAYFKILVFLVLIFVLSSIYMALIKRIRMLLDQSELWLKFFFLIIGGTILQFGYVAIWELIWGHVTSPLYLVLLFPMRIPTIFRGLFFLLYFVGTTSVIMQLLRPMMREGSRRAQVALSPRRKRVLRGLVVGLYAYGILSCLFQFTLCISIFHSAVSYDFLMYGLLALFAANAIHVGWLRTATV